MAQASKEAWWNGLSASSAVPHLALVQLARRPPGTQRPCLPASANAPVRAWLKVSGLSITDMLITANLVSRGSIRQPSVCNRHARTVAAAVRERKNPADFGSMEELRAHLHRGKEGPAAGLTGILNWISETARYGQQAPAWWPTPQPPSSADEDMREALSRLGVQQHQLSQLALLMLCSETCAAKIVLKYPAVLQQEPAEVQWRLICLKQLLPNSDVARIVEQQPSIFLGVAASELEGQVSSALAKLRQGLPGCEVEELVQEDPSILMFDDLATGIRRVHELWPDLDEDALRNSDPGDLALAVRALSDRGPPKKWS